MGVGVWICDIGRTEEVMLELAGAYGIYSVLPLTFTSFKDHLFSSFSVRVPIVKETYWEYTGQTRTYDFHFNRLAFKNIGDVVTYSILLTSNTKWTNVLCTI